MAPSNVTIQFVEKPTDGHVEEAVQIFVDLMGPEAPGQKALTGGNTDLIPMMARAEISPVITTGHLWTASDENGTMIGFTIWSPPGESFFETEQAKLGLSAYLDALSEEGRNYYAHTMGAAMNQIFDDIVGIPSSLQNTYYCSFAFVRADYHNKGVVKAMFEQVYEKARETSSSILCLATKTILNVQIYERLGFDVKGHKIMEAPWGDWPAWIMTRDIKAER